MVNYCSSELKLMCLAGIQLNVISTAGKNRLSDLVHFPNI